MKKKVMWVTLTLVLVIGIAQLAAAAPWGFGGRFAADPTKLAADLGLTDEQVEQIKDLQTQMQEARQKFQQKFESILTPEQLEKAKSLRGFRPDAAAPNFGLVKEELGLTDEQVNQIQELQREMYEATKELRSKLQDAMFELRQLKWEKNPDQEAVDAKTKEVNDLRAQLQEVTQEYQQKFESILTAEQLEKAKSLRGFGGFGGRRGPRGMGGFGAPPADAPVSGTSPQA